MSWQGEMTTIVRQLINDVDPTNYTYTDSRLETVILVAAQIAALEVDFERTYIIDVEQCMLTPDPTDPSTSLSLANKDDSFINLVSLKAACIVMMSEWKTYGLQAVSVTDGPSSIDYKAIATHIKAQHEYLCKNYEEYKFNYQSGIRSVGKAILSPYSPGSDVAVRLPNNYRNYFR